MLTCHKNTNITPWRHSQEFIPKYWILFLGSSPEEKTAQEKENKIPVHRCYVTFSPIIYWFVLSDPNTPPGQRIPSAYLVLVRGAMSGGCMQCDSSKNPEMDSANYYKSNAIDASCSESLPNVKRRRHTLPQSGCIPYPRPFVRHQYNHYQHHLQSITTKELQLNRGDTPTPVLGRDTINRIFKIRNVNISFPTAETESCTADPSRSLPDLSIIRPTSKLQYKVIAFLQCRSVTFVISCEEQQPQRYLNKGYLARISVIVKNYNYCVWRRSWGKLNPSKWTPSWSCSLLW